MLEEKELQNGSLSGVKSEELLLENVRVTRIKVLDKNGEKALGKPIGSYTTIEIPNLENYGGSFDNATKIIAEEIGKMAEKSFESVLFVGIGNYQITPDALGPKTAAGILATRHLGASLKKELGLESFRVVSNCGEQAGQSVFHLHFHVLSGRDMTWPPG